MHLLAAPDKFRGTATAAEAAAAMAQACDAMGWRCTLFPLADGGEGTLEVFGGANRSSWVTGPLGQAIEAGWRLDGETAVIEMARASGLVVAGGIEGNDPIRATSRGAGQLIECAIREGARRVILGVGGSACTDGGWGAVEVLARYAPLDGSKNISVVVACDVRTTFTEAAVLFGSQKGADAGQILALTARLERLVQTYRGDHGVDVRQIRGGGAAGGLAGGLAAIGARVESGFDLIAAELGFASALSTADLVITGEGKLDQSSFAGKVVGGVLRQADAVGIRRAVIVGQVDDELALDGNVISLTKEYGSEQAYGRTAHSITEATKILLQQSTDVRSVR
jgi:glycerate kinase